MQTFTDSYSENLHLVNKMLRTGENFDIIVKRILLGGKNATLYCIDGFVKDVMLEKMLEYFTKLTEKEMNNAQNAQQLVDRYITYVEADTEEDTEAFITLILTGAVGMIVEGYSRAIIIDSRTYPARDVQEPESDKVLRGSHEGFVETIVFNTALIRRKIRNPNLTMKSFQVGRSSKTDIVISYLEDKVDKKLLKTVVDKLNSIDVDSLSMSHESIKECLVPGQPLNPFPKFRYTERPDAAAACIYDGNIILLTDGSPTAIILPTGIFDFVQDINDFYFSPFIGTFLRLVRATVFFLTLFLVPCWYLYTQYHVNLPGHFKFMLIEEPNTVPIIAQLLIVEFVIDTLRLASLNTPNALSNSFSVVGALVLGEFAVRSGWFVSEVVLFMAFVAIANFTQPSYELGYAIKISRTFILILCALFKIWGLVAGAAIVFAVIASTKTINGYTYLYPLIPFDKKAFKSLLYRRPLKCDYK
ncbi:MAG: spore germination protein [Ruminococcaceae bacterium]|nr:spore germination protein [Oscillospiraceae bacterium]